MFIRITLNGERKEVSLKNSINPDSWDVINKTVTKIEPDFRNINLSIASAKTDLVRIYDALWHKYDVVTSAMIGRAYLGKAVLPIAEPSANEKQGMTLLNAFDEFIIRFEKLVKKGKRSEGTLRHWRTTKTKVLKFLMFKFKKKDIFFDEIDTFFADHIYDYLTLDAEKQMAEPTAKKHIKSIKQIIKIGVKSKAIGSNPIADFKCGCDEPEIPPLELHQVYDIFNKDFGIERLNEVRDVYTFQCFTGFAYGDLEKLSPENIILIGNSKERWLIKDRGKTGVSEMVPILPIVEKLIEKYKKHPKCRMKNRLMPVDSNVRYNGYLKEIGTVCRIDRELNTHLARHTFADIMLNSGVPLEDVGKMLGHKSIRTTQRYCRVRKQRISENMKIARKKLFTPQGKLKLVG